MSFEYYDENSDVKITFLRSLYQEFDISEKGYLSVLGCLCALEKLQIDVDETIILKFMQEQKYLTTSNSKKVKIPFETFLQIATDFEKEKKSRKNSSNENFPILNHNPHLKLTFYSNFQLAYTNGSKIFQSHNFLPENETINPIALRLAKNYRILDIEKNILAICLTKNSQHLRDVWLWLKSITADPTSSNSNMMTRSLIERFAIQKVKEKEQVNFFGIFYYEDLSLQELFKLGNTEDGSKSALDSMWKTLAFYIFELDFKKALSFFESKIKIYIEMNKATDEEVFVAKTSNQILTWLFNIQCLIESDNELKKKLSIGSNVLSKSTSVAIDNISQNFVSPLSKNKMDYEMIDKFKEQEIDVKIQIIQQSILFISDISQFTKFQNPYLNLAFKLFEKEEISPKFLKQLENVDIFTKFAFCCKFFQDYKEKEFLSRMLKVTENDFDINRIPILGFSKESVDLLRNFLDHEDDIQSVALISVYFLKFGNFAKREKGLLLQFIEFYKRVLTKLRYYDEKIAFEFEFSVLNEIKRDDNFFCKCDFGHFYCVAKPQAIFCKFCHKPKDFCSVCQKSSKNKDDSNNSLVCICQQCYHGGHVNHINEWFKFSEKCAYVDCHCECYKYLN